MCLNNFGFPNRIQLCNIVLSIVEWPIVNLILSTFVLGTNFGPTFDSHVLLNFLTKYSR